MSAQTDRELLELAAKAARADGWFNWNPLTDDGDALRLAVKLGIHVRHYGGTHLCENMDGKFLADEVDAEGDGIAATRRAIVRAAAAIGATK